MDIIYQLDIVSGKLVAEFKSVEDIPILFPDKKPSTVRSHIGSSLRGNRNTAYGFRWAYKSKITDLTTYLAENRPKNLFIDLYPQLIEEWDFKTNVDININTITYGAETIVSWKCPAELGHQNYYMSLNGRTSGGNKIKGCPECGKRINIFHDPIEKKAEMNRVKGRK